MPLKYHTRQGFRVFGLAIIGARRLHSVAAEWPEFGPPSTRLLCRESIRCGLHRLGLSWKKARKLLGRADPARRMEFIQDLRALRDGAQRDRYQLVYVDEAHIHQDVDLGYGWGVRGAPFHVASSSPGLSAKVSFYGLYLYNEGQVRIWPYPRASGEHTTNVLRRLRETIPTGRLIVIWD